MAPRPPWLPGGGGGVGLIVLLLIIVAVLIFWAWSTHPPGSSQPSVAGVPPTPPAKALPTSH